MFILLNKKNESLFGAPPVRCPYPHHSTLLHLHSASCHILVHVKSARLNTPLTCHYVQALVVLEGNRSKTSPLFFRIEIILPKCPNFAWQNGMFIKKTISTQTMISCVMSCNSRFI